MSFRIAGDDVLGGLVRDASEGAGDPRQNWSAGASA